MERYIYILSMNPPGGCVTPLARCLTLLSAMTLLEALLNKDTEASPLFIIERQMNPSWREPI